MSCKCRYVEGIAAQTLDSCAPFTLQRCCSGTGGTVVSVVDVCRGVHTRPLHTRLWSTLLSETVTLRLQNCAFVCLFVLSVLDNMSAHRVINPATSAALLMTFYTFCLLAFTGMFAYFKCGTVFFASIAAWINSSCIPGVLEKHLKLWMLFE